MSVFSRSHRGQMSDSMLTAAFIILSGGLKDAYTSLCRGKVYANAQTGNIVLLSTYLCNGEWAAAGRYLVPVLAFMAGIFAAECVHRRFRRMDAHSLSFLGPVPDQGQDRLWQILLQRLVVMDHLPCHRGA